MGPLVFMLWREYTQQRRVIHSLLKASLPKWCCRNPYKQRHITSTQHIYLVVSRFCITLLQHMSIQGQGGYKSYDFRIFTAWLLELVKMTEMAMYCLVSIINHNYSLTSKFFCFQKLTFKWKRFFICR